MLATGSILSLRRSRRLLRGGIGVLWLGLLGFQTVGSASSICPDGVRSLTASTSTGPAAAETEAMPMGDRSSGTMHHGSSRQPTPRHDSHCSQTMMTGACVGCAVVAVNIAASTAPQLLFRSQPYDAPRGLSSASEVAPDVPPPRA